MHINLERHAMFKVSKKELARKSNRDSRASKKMSSPVKVLVSDGKLVAEEYGSISNAIRMKGYTPVASGIPTYERDVNSKEFLFSNEWRVLRAVVLRKYGHTCMRCGATPADGDTMNVDHIKPRKYYPELALDEKNCQILCPPCNKDKGNWDTTDYRPAEVSVAESGVKVVKPTQNKPANTKKPAAANRSNKTKSKSTSTTKHKNSVVKVWLKVPFEEKDVARAAGAKWDRGAKLWYADSVQSILDTARWMPHKIKGCSRAPSLDDTKILA